MNFSFYCVTIVLVLAVVLGILANYWRKELVYWFILVMFIVKIHAVIKFNKAGDVYYREFNYYLYSAIKVSSLIVKMIVFNHLKLHIRLLFWNLWSSYYLQILNFCIYLSRTKETNISPQLFFRYIQYIVYPPYAIVLIVLFNDFDAEMTKIENGSANSIAYRLLFIFFTNVFRTSYQSNTLTGQELLDPRKEVQPGWFEKITIPI